MRYTFFLSFLLFLSASVYAAKVPSRYRMELAYGYTVTDYEENQFTNLKPPLDNNQVSGALEATFHYFLIPPYLDFKLGVDYVGVNVFKNDVEGVEIEQIKDEGLGGEQFTYLTALATFGIIMPELTEHLQLKLNIERFYTTMIVDGNEFGFRNLQGWQVYPDIEWLTFSEGRFFKMSTFFKIPLWTDVGNRRETTIGFKFRVPIGSSRGRSFPLYAYERAITLKAYYTDIDLSFERADARNAAFDVRQYGLVLGVNF